MSGSDGDLSNELLELAGATEKKRKRREGSSKSETNRRRAEYVVPLAYSTSCRLLFPCSPGMDTTSDADGPESEENDIERKSPPS